MRPSFWTVAIRSRKTEKNWEKIEFTMGNEVGEPDEWGSYQQCIHHSFWIDKYEVTNQQFKQFSGEAQVVSPDYTVQTNRPRVFINWLEARIFCEMKRNSYLPTEIEWEYSAQGPSNLKYPWGNIFLQKNLVYKE